LKILFSANLWDKPLRPYDVILLSCLSANRNMTMASAAMTMKPSKIAMARA
jgi:hypothetical protein